MSNMTQMDLAALKEFKRELETFVQSITTHCNMLENGLSDCSQYMQDANSQKMLTRGQMLCKNIKHAADPIVPVLEKVQRIISHMESIQEMEQ